jgi:putative endonuclease
VNTKKSDLGKRGEDFAYDLLIQKGYEIIKRNYRYSHGEIDLVAFDKRKNYLVFVEVKTRFSLEMGDPAYSITRKKISQLKKIAELYLYENNIKNMNCRFDVITVLLSDPEKPIIEHYEDAFM